MITFIFKCSKKKMIQLLQKKNTTHSRTSLFIRHISIILYSLLFLFYCYYHKTGYNIQINNKQLSQQKSRKTSNLILSICDFKTKVSSYSLSTVEFPECSTIKSSMRTREIQTNVVSSAPQRLQYFSNIKLWLIPKIPETLTLNQYHEHFRFS